VSLKVFAYNPGVAGPAGAAVLIDCPGEKLPSISLANILK
jgi:hypothetical protein